MDIGRIGTMATSRLDIVVALGNVIVNAIAIGTNVAKIVRDRVKSGTRTGTRIVTVGPSLVCQIVCGIKGRRISGVGIGPGNLIALGNAMAIVIVIAIVAIETDVVIDPRSVTVPCGRKTFVGAAGARIRDPVSDVVRDHRDRSDVDVHLRMVFAFETILHVRS